MGLRSRFLCASLCWCFINLSATNNAGLSPSGVMEMVEVSSFCPAAAGILKLYSLLFSQPVAPGNAPLHRRGHLQLSRADGGSLAFTHKSPSSTSTTIGLSLNHGIT